MRGVCLQSVLSSIHSMELRAFSLSMYVHTHNPVCMYARVHSHECMWLWRLEDNLDPWPLTLKSYSRYLFLFPPCLGKKKLKKKKHLLTFSHLLQSPFCSFWNWLFLYYRGLRVLCMSLIQVLTRYVIWKYFSVWRWYFHSQNGVFCSKSF